MPMHAPAKVPAASADTMQATVFQAGSGGAAWADTAPRRITAAPTRTWRKGRSAILFLFRLPLAYRERAQAQRVELDEAGRILLVVGALVVLEGDEILGVERIGRGAADHHRIALVELEPDRAGDELLALVDQRLEHLAFR